MAAHPSSYEETMDCRVKPGNDGGWDNAGPTQSQPAGQQAAMSASSMIARMVRAQRPHCGLQPRQS